MNIYLIERKGTIDYDEYDSAVVCAESEKDARNTHPSGDNKYFSDSTWDSPENIKVKLLGLASEDINEGVIVASFNVG